MARALLGGTGLVGEADVAQVVPGQAREQVGDVALEAVARLLEGPGVVAQELLQGAYGGAGLQGDGLDALARQVGEQAATVVVEVGGGSVLEEAGAEVAQERGKRGAKVSDILIGHGVFPPGDPIILLSSEPAL